jgi:hypothetical protein
MTPTDIFAALADLCIRRVVPHVRLRNPLVRFQEYLYGTTIQHNYNAGWGVITMSSYDVFQQTCQLLGCQTVMLGQILPSETDPLYSWQYNESYPCPNGCQKQMSKTRGYLGCVDPNA